MAAHPATGETFELNAIAAAVLGGTSMSGGRGTIGGTIIGAFVIGILSDGLVMMGVSSFWQMVIKGVVIIAAVVVDQAQRKLQQRVALQQMAATDRKLLASEKSRYCPSIGAVCEMIQRDSQSCRRRKRPSPTPTARRS